MSKPMRSAIHRFNDLFCETEALYHEIFLSLGQSDSAMKILYTLCDAGTPCPLQVVCRRSGLSKQTVNSALRKLEQAGVLYLESAGPRTKQICLTPAGQALVARTAEPLLQAETAIFDGWDPQEVETYLALTERFLRDLRKQAATLPSHP